MLAPQWTNALRCSGGTTKESPTIVTPIGVVTGSGRRTIAKPATRNALCKRLRGFIIALILLVFFMMSSPSPRTSRDPTTDAAGLNLSCGSRPISVWSRCNGCLELSLGSSVIYLSVWISDPS